MVEYYDQRLDAVFAALSDPTRRAILERLTAGEATVGDLARPHDMTMQAVSKHLRKLEAAGLVRRRREGREVHCRIETEPMRRAVSWLEEQRRFWEVRLDRLDAVLRERQERGREAADRGGRHHPPAQKKKGPDHGHERH